MRITAIKRQKRHRERLNIYVDGDFRLSLSEEVAARAHLHTGDELDQERAEALQSQDLVWRARQAALNLLSYRPRTESELRNRLLRMQMPAETVESCILELRRINLVDDAAFARTFARERVQSRPKGRHFVVAELRARGVDPDLAGSAVAEALDDASLSDLQLARNAAVKFRRRSGEVPRKSRSRLFGFLGRRGFDADVIRQVADELDL